MNTPDWESLRLLIALGVRSASVSAGMWKYSEVLGLSFNERVSHGEGGTPQIPVWVRSDPDTDRDVLLKLESRNPTGSIEDRTMSVGISVARAQGILALRLRSELPGALSAASYGALGGFPMQLEVPYTISDEILERCHAFGAGVSISGGWPDDPGTLEFRACANDSWQALAGARLQAMRTLAFEVIETTKGQLPGAVVIPWAYRHTLRDLQLAFSELASLPWIVGAMPSFFTAAIRKRRDCTEGQIAISREDALRSRERLAREFGILVALDSAATVEAAHRVQFPDAGPAVAIDCSAREYETVNNRAISASGAMRREQSKLGGLITPR